MSTKRNINRAATKSFSATFNFDLKGKPNSSSYLNRLYKNSMRESYVWATPFKATYNMFRDYLGYTDPLTYEEWITSPDDDKAAILYVQFYDQITLAWYKVHKLWGEDAEGVETVIQYLLKNVPTLIDRPDRFYAGYIYRVAYNCLYCICHDRQIDKDRWSLEISNIVHVDSGDELDLFDTVPEDVDMDKLNARDRLWEIVESLDAESQQVIAEIFGETSKGRKKIISEERRAEIMSNLQEQLKEFYPIFCS